MQQTRDSDERTARQLEAGMHADPFAFRCEPPPGNASIVFASAHEWQDTGWLEQRSQSFGFDQPISIYEVHAGSWRRRTEYGDRCHQAGIGVILDWVAAHFPTDPYGLGRFDGTAVYEHADPRRGIHADWDTLVFNYGRAEVANYLIANALYWIREFHIDALRLDAVASMLYLDYSRADDELVHGKRSILGRMPGDDWHLLANERHAGVSRLIRDLNSLYREVAALHEIDYEPEGFRWLNCDERGLSVFSFARFDREAHALVAIANFMPVVRDEYRLGVPVAGEYTEVLNTDAGSYGGSGVGNLGRVAASSEPRDWLPATLELRLPPLATLFLRAPAVRTEAGAA